MSKKGEFSQRKSREFVDQKTDVIEFDFQTVNCSTKHGEDCQKKYFFLVGYKARVKFDQPQAQTDFFSRMVN